MSDRESQLLEKAQTKGPLGKFLIYARLSGPGWLQGAITLGGGSLAGALYLGVIAGFGLMWLQPLAMICGIIMLSAIAYVTLSTGQRPFHAINRHLHPLLGWSWLAATILANMVWVMPQFSLATAAIQQNLFSDKIPVPAITITLFLIGMGVNWLYESGGRAAKVFDGIIKLMVGVIVLSFFAVVIALTKSGQLDWGAIAAGFVPDPSLLTRPSSTLGELVAQSNFADFWTDKIVKDQRDIIITAFGTAVGINMTFLLPYTLLQRKWGKRHRGLSITDLSVGLFIPFFLATSCVVIASASSFHGKAPETVRFSWWIKQGAMADDFVPPPGGGVFAGAAVVNEVTRTPAEIASLAGSLQMSGTTGAVFPESRENLSKQLGENHEFLLMEGEPRAVDFQLAQMLKKRDANALAVTLEPFAGKTVSQKIFGIGVLGMALSTIVILMLMNGTAFLESFSQKPADHGPDETPQNKPLFFLGCAMSGLSGACFPFLWTGASKAALAVPTSVIGGSLIPIAYFTFLLMMNSRHILGDQRPTGGRRVLWNTLMILATGIATAGSVWVLYGKTSATDWTGTAAWLGLAFLALLFVVGTISYTLKERRS